MKKIIIIGAGGLGREVIWLINRINEAYKQNPFWEIVGFVDDGIKKSALVDGYPILGDVNSLLIYKETVYIACAIANTQIRKTIIQKLSSSPYLKFPNLVDPSVIISNTVKMGIGNVICAGSILTIHIDMQDFNIINPNCTLGHDTVLESYITIYPGSNISGNVSIGNQSELGTGMRIIQGKTIGREAVIGAGSIVIENIPSYCTAVGCPAKPIKFKTN